MITYTTVLKKGVKAEEAIITAKGYESNFTLNDIHATIAKGEKALKELSSNYDIKKSVMDNIEKHHKFVLKFTDEELFTLHMYFEAKAHANTYSKEIKSLKKAIKQEKDDMKEIFKQIPELDVKL